MRKCARSSLRYRCTIRLSINDSDISRPNYIRLATSAFFRECLRRLPARLLFSPDCPRIHLSSSGHLLYIAHERAPIAWRLPTIYNEKEWLFNLRLEALRGFKLRLMRRSHPNKALLSGAVHQLGIVQSPRSNNHDVRAREPVVELLIKSDDTGVEARVEMRQCKELRIEPDIDRRETEKQNELKSVLTP